MAKPSTAPPPWATTANYGASVYPATYPWGAAHPSAGLTTGWSTGARRNASGLAGAAAAGFEPYKPFPAQKLNEWFRLVQEACQWVFDGTSSPLVSAHVVETDGAGVINARKGAFGSHAGGTDGLALNAEQTPTGSAPVVLFDGRNAGTLNAIAGAVLEVRADSLVTLPAIRANHAADNQNAITAVATGSGALAALFASSAYHAIQVQPNATHAGLRLAGLSSDPSTIVGGGISYRSDTGELRTPNRDDTQTYSLMAAPGGWACGIAGGGDVVTTVGIDRIIETVNVYCRPGRQYVVFAESSVETPAGASSGNGGTHRLEIDQPTLGTVTTKTWVFNLDTQGSGMGQRIGTMHAFSVAEEGIHTIRWEADILTADQTFKNPAMLCFGDVTTTIA